MRRKDEKTVEIETKNDMKEKRFIVWFLSFSD